MVLVVKRNRFKVKPASGSSGHILHTSALLRVPHHAHANQKWRITPPKGASISLIISASLGNRLGV